MREAHLLIGLIECILTGIYPTARKQVHCPDAVDAIGFFTSQCGIALPGPKYIGREVIQEGEMIRPFPNSFSVIAGILRSPLLIVASVFAPALLLPLPVREVAMVAEGDPYRS
jgi:hypothetical protein